MRRQDFKIEVCTNSVESVRAALAGGADRIELCAGMPEERLLRMVRFV